MYIGLFDMFKIGIGPSSSHTVGPMRAARRFLMELPGATFDAIARLEVQLYGSLAHTGHGHGTDVAILLGLCGELPDQVDTDGVPARVQAIRDTQRLALLGRKTIAFDVNRALVFNRSELLPVHSNGMRFQALDAHGAVLAERDLYSIGGGFVVDTDEAFVGSPRGVEEPVPRRARGMAERMRHTPQYASEGAMNWVSAYAIAVNEENAAGGRVVTAPTNGAAGVVPAVLRYYQEFRGGDDAGIERFMLGAAAVGGLCKRNASISGAEVGCQGEVGSAAAMAAAGLAAALGASNEQIENAAEIALEHHLGMTCDPIGGLVQVPCIERNAMGAIKAINACSLAMLGNGAHLVSLDQAIDTMRRTGSDMQSKYKETSLGGLALSVSVRLVEC